MTTSAIPTFLLYGEELSEPSSHFAHIETIAARSSLHDWEIRAHRHQHSIQIFLVSKGQVEFHCDGLVETLVAPCFMAVPVGSVHAFVFQPETTGHVLSLSAAFPTRAKASDDPLLHMLTQGASGALPATAHERVKWICGELLALQDDWRTPSELFLTLAEALVRCLEHGLEAVPGRRAEDSRLAAFRRLVELHLTEHHPLEWYAGELGITSKTLTRICRRKLDCTPTQLIHNRLILEAQRLLCFTNTKVVDVADELGFSDPSYFSRFYQRMTGHRPGQDKIEAPAPTPAPAPG